MTEMFGEAWSPMSVPDLAPDDDDDAFGPPSEPARRSEKEAVAAETPDLNDVRRSRQ